LAGFVVIVGEVQPKLTVTVTVREFADPHEFVICAQNEVVELRACVVKNCPEPTGIDVSGAAPRYQVTVPAVPV
jgi:hypothetical protein